MGLCAVLEIFVILITTQKLFPAVRVGIGVPAQSVV